MIKLSELESWLWEAANKGDTEFASFPENHQFPIPEGCHWKEIRAHTVNGDQAISTAMKCIEKANPNTLYGIFRDAQWTNKDRPSNKLLIDLIEHFSMHQLSNSNVEPDIAGQAYEYLIKEFADVANKKAGEYYTPRSIVRLMTKILEPKEGETIYDPACETGGMLLEAVHYVRQNSEDLRTLRLYGQEKNLITSSIACMNLFLHGVKDFNIVSGDTLRQPAFFEGNKLSNFDVVNANLPVSLKNGILIYG